MIGIPKKVVIWGDVHIPFHDRAAHSILLKYLRLFMPNVVVINGDLIDMYAVAMSFDRDPKRRQSIPDDIAAANEYLDSIDAVLPPHTRKVFLEGNHEDRLRRYLWERAPELSGILGASIPEMLRLPARGWEHIPYYRPVAHAGSPGLWLYGILVTHGSIVGKWSAMTARRMFERYNCSGVSGHTHRLGSFYHRTYGGMYVWLESGCMCQLEPPYMSSPDWQQGFVSGYIHDYKEGNPEPRFELSQRFIYNNKLSCEGNLIVADCE